MMKNAILTAGFVITFMISGTALAETAKPVKPIKGNIDMTTTQSIGEKQGCSMSVAEFKHTDCGKTQAGNYPDNALSGMNFGF